MPWAARDTYLAAAIALAAIVIYLPGLSAGFVADDFLILWRIEERHGLREALTYFSLGFFDYYRPVAFLSHALDWTIWGSNAFGFHLTNVVIHGTNAGLVFILGRRLASRTASAIGALLFTAHPANSEAVYWIAARFDLMATGFALVSLISVLEPGRLRLAVGATAFFVALLCKESVVALPIATMSHDLFWKRLAISRTILRAIPTVMALVAYAALRAGVGNLAAAGGTERLGKVAMLVAAVCVLLLLASRARRQDAEWPARSSRVPTLVAVAICVVLMVAVLVPATHAWTVEKLTFVSYAAYHLAVPIVVPPPPPYFLDPTTPVYWIAGLIAVFVLANVVIRLRTRLAAQSASPLAWFVVASLIPVSTLTGGTRYFYLASAGVALIIGQLVEHAVADSRPHWFARTAVALFLFISVAQVVIVSSTWRWAGAMTTEASTTLVPRLQPCGERRLLLATAPVNIGGVYSNINEEVFSVLGRCPVLSVRAVSRVVRRDARVDILDEGPGHIGWRVPDYDGNVVVSRDLRTFDIPLRARRRVVIESEAGRLESFDEGTSQRFRLTLNAEARKSVLAYYSEGAVRPWPKTID